MALSKVFVATLFSYLISSVCLNAQTCLQGYFPFDGDATDMSSNSNDGTLSGTSPTADRNGQAGRALDLNGTSEYVLLPSEYDFPVRTIMMWFNADQIGTTQGVLYNSDNSGIQNGSTIVQVLEQSGTDYLRMSIGSGSQGVHLEPINPNQWYMFTVVRGNSDLKFYLDCNLVATLAMHGGSSVDGQTGTTRVGVNRHVNGAYFDGQIDELRVFDCELSAAQICNVFNAGCLQGAYTMDGNASDLGPNLFDGTVNGATLTAGKHNTPNAAYLFDGNDYISLPSEFDFPQRTISATFRADVIQATPGVVFNSDNPTIQHGSTIIQAYESNGDSILRMSIGNGSTAVHEEPINTGQWYTATIVRGDSLMEYYLDCEKVATFPLHGGSSTVDGEVGTSRIGVGRLLTNNFFNGAIDNVLIYDCALEEAEVCGILGIHQSAAEEGKLEVFPNPSAGLVQFDLGEDFRSPVTLELFSSDGRLAHTSILNDQLSSVDLSGYSPGVYMYSITTSEGVRMSGQLIIQP